MIVLRSKSFGQVKKENKAKKKAWEGKDHRSKASSILDELLDEEKLKESSKRAAREYLRSKKEKGINKGVDFVSSEYKFVDSKEIGDDEVLRHINRRNNKPDIESKSLKERLKDPLTEYELKSKLRRYREHMKNVTPPPPPIIIPERENLTDKQKLSRALHEGNIEDIKQLGRVASFMDDAGKFVKKNKRPLIATGVGLASIGTGIAIGNKLREKEYSEPITTKDRIKKAGMAGGVFGALGGIAGGIATKSMKGVKVGAAIGAGIGSGLSLYGSHKYNKDLKNKIILDQNREQEREREFQENKKLLPVRSYEEFYKQNPRIKKELDDNNLDYFSDYNIPGFKYLKEDGLDITRYLPLTYDSNSTILAVYDLKDKKLKLWDPEVSNELENLGSLKNLY